MNKFIKKLIFIFFVTSLHQTNAGGPFLTRLNPWFKVACIAENIKVRPSQILEIKPNHCLKTSYIQTQATKIVD